VAIGVKPQPESVLQPMKKLEGYRVVRPVLTPTKLEAEGWAMRQSAPGFRQVSCVKRPMDGSADHKAAAAGQQVLQTIFSDGLTYVSVFIEPFDPQRHTRPMLASVGPTQTLMQQQGDWWVTVVGDVPPATLKLFAKGLERWRRNGALEIEVTEHTADRYSFNVTRCRYAEMYQALGMRDLGGALSCQRDHALIDWFNPNIKLTRTQTIMEGKSFCDFRFTMAASPAPAGETTPKT